MTFDPTDADFSRVRAWPNARDPLAAIRDYSPLKAALRWFKSSHRRRAAEYTVRRAEWTKARNFEQYFKEADRTIDRRRWEYLKLRKSWYIMPLEWDRFAARDVTRVLDLGCGDGDATQRLAEHVARVWLRDGGAHDLEIVGIDLGESRIRNARAHCSPPDPHIRFTFLAADVTKELPFPERHFDHAFCSGVFEILEDAPARAFMRALCLMTRRGIHIEDLLDRYPGGYPREYLDPLMAPFGFAVKRRHLVLTEPFTLFGEPDPMALWPILRDQNVWAERVT